MQLQIMEQVVRDLDDAGPDDQDEKRLG